MLLCYCIYRVSGGTATQSVYCHTMETELTIFRAVYPLNFLGRRENKESCLSENSFAFPFSLFFISLIYFFLILLFFFMLYACWAIGILHSNFIPDWSITRRSDRQIAYQFNLPATRDKNRLRFKYNAQYLRYTFFPTLLWFLSFPL